MRNSGQEETITVNKIITWLDQNLNSPHLSPSYNPIYSQKINISLFIARRIC